MERPELVDPLPAGPVSKIPYSPPAEAERLADGGYRWTDPGGVVWIYRQNAFGWGRAKESEIVPAGRAAVSPSLAVTAVEGDKVRFKQDGPFGLQTWTRTKSDLNADEREALRRHEEVKPLAVPAKAAPADGAAKQAAKKGVERLAVPGAVSQPAKKEKN
jgi:hypothetical protein